MGRSVHDVDGDAHVPVALGRAVAALDVGLEFYREAQVAQDLLELLLLAVTPVDGIGIGFDYLPLLADIRPQRRIVEVATIGLTNGVVEVLDIGEQRFSSPLILMAQQRKGWIGPQAPKSRPVCQSQGLFRE